MIRPGIDVGELVTHGDTYAPLVRAVAGRGARDEACMQRVGLRAKQTRRPSIGTSMDRGDKRPAFRRFPPLSASSPR
jgi:hypothetical protein